MANIYEIKLVSLRKENLDNLQNAIVYVNWTISGKDDDGNYASYDNSTTFDLEGADSENFIAYDNLTEEIVTNWVTDIIGFETDSLQWENIKSIIDRELQRRYNQKKAVFANEFPWAPEVELPSGSIS
jgi:hypothetical protein